MRGGEEQVRANDLFRACISNFSNDAARSKTHENKTSGGDALEQLREAFAQEGVELEAIQYCWDELPQHQLRAAVALDTVMESRRQGYARARLSLRAMREVSESRLIDCPLGGQKHRDLQHCWGISQRWTGPAWRTETQGPSTLLGNIAKVDRTPWYT
ncbi:hypothetical protein V8C35DRAFT_316627 [Trichoderma chlorosporum]